MGVLEWKDELRLWLPSVKITISVIWNGFIQCSLSRNLLRGSV